MIRTPSHKLFVSYKEQVEPTHISLDTFRFSRKYQLFLKFPEDCKVDPCRTNAVSTDNDCILINIPFSDNEKLLLSEESLSQCKTTKELTEEKLARKLREEESLAIQKGEQTPFIMERIPLFRGIYVKFCQILKRDIPSVRKRKRILLSIRSSFFKYLRGDLSLWELKQVVNRSRKNSRMFAFSKKLQPDDDCRQKVSKQHSKSTKEMLLRVAEEIGSKVESMQQMKDEKEKQHSLLFHSRQQKGELRRERRRLKRKFAKKLAHQRKVKSSEQVMPNLQLNRRDPVVRFSVKT
ncbi:hypothetical protein GpartN1_g3274.t1 [Galdieria partita]|uniref:Uncharacterized protein n=1 Tax=Galdieria partita TaxID=83374 RepID=A0A9C7UQ39_9RHOD|nr:hypothetical protein GpartN1_g3274.t1 [Galdieria partita]